MAKAGNKPSDHQRMNRCTKGDLSMQSNSNTPREDDPGGYYAKTEDKDHDSTYTKCPEQANSQTKAAGVLGAR